MDYERILSKKQKYEAGRHKIHSLTLSSYEKDFELTFTHHSTAIEGNTLTLMETKVILEDGISIGGKSLREIYEVVNHKKAYGYVKKCVASHQQMTEEIAKEYADGEYYDRRHLSESGGTHQRSGPCSSCRK